MLSDAKVSKVIPGYSSQVITGMPGIIAHFSSKVLCPHFHLFDNVCHRKQTPSSWV